MPSDFLYPVHYDVIVIGAGHAGVEAALAAARLGCRTALLTQNLDTVAQMSCNPAIGGLAKGNLVREIDALGGAMGLNTDATAIQFRMLNGTKGPSVRSPRAQADKKAYQFRMKWILENTPNLELHQGNVAEIFTQDSRVTGMRTSLGLRFACRALILSAGTFMRGLLHVGLQNAAGGRMGDSLSTVSDSLRQLGFEVRRFKTGTPCRLNGRSIDLSVCERQGGDTPPPRFSFLSDTLGGPADDIFTLNRWSDPMFHVEQIPCWVTHTNPGTHDVIRANLDKSPMYAGIIEGVGPRYCPSIEDKVVRFADKDRHQLFLEPEGRHTNEYYVNGVSTSLPYEVQYAFIRSVRGLENAEIIRPGYAVEYDYCPPSQLFPTMETKRVEHLYFAGQINGTSGYEEAAGQGLIAGTNAALKLRDGGQYVPGRSESYLGVMIDDLVTKEVLEPYRLFTSRAEYRLLLRQDNCDLRLTPAGAALGLVTPERARRASERRVGLNTAHQLVQDTRYEGLPLEKWFKRPENTWPKLSEDLKAAFPPEVWEMVETDVKYAGYLDRQQAMVDRVAKMEDRRIPTEWDYALISGLKREASQKLASVRPLTLGQAGRIQGVTPADIAILTLELERRTGTL